MASMEKTPEYLVKKGKRKTSLCPHIHLMLYSRQ